MRRHLAIALMGVTSLVAGVRHHPASFYRCGNFQARTGYDFVSVHDGTLLGQWHGFKGQVIGWGTDEHTTIYPDQMCVPRSWISLPGHPTEDQIDTCENSGGGAFGSNPLATKQEWWCEHKY